MENVLERFLANQGLEKLIREGDGSSIEPSHIGIPVAELPRVYNVNTRIGRSFGSSGCR